MVPDGLQRVGVRKALRVVDQPVFAVADGLHRARQRGPRNAVVLGEPGDPQAGVEQRRDDLADPVISPVRHRVRERGVGLHVRDPNRASEIVSVPMWRVRPDVALQVHAAQPGHVAEPWPVEPDDMADEVRLRDETPDLVTGGRAVRRHAVIPVSPDEVSVIGHPGNLSQVLAAGAG